MSYCRIKRRQVKFELPKIRWTELAHLELHSHHRPQGAMIEQEVYEHLFPFNDQSLLAPHKAEVVAAKRLYGLFHVDNKRLG